MRILSSKKIYTKVVSFFVTFLFLVESTLAPVLLFLPQMASAQSVTISIPVVSVSPNSFYPGAQMTTSVTQGAPNAQVLLFCRDPKGAVCDDANSGTTNSSGQFSRSYDTTGWTVGAYTGWVTVAGIKSNVVSFTVLAPVAADTKTPIGFLDGIDASGNAFGWALDPDNSSQSIAVNFYIDGIAGSSGAVYAGSAFANLPRPDLNTAYPGNHGYTFSIPQQWRDGKTHKLYVHGIDVSGDGTKNVLLSQVPKSFTLGTATPIPVVSVSPNSFYPGAQMTTSITKGAPNAQVLLFCRDPNGAVCDDANSGTTNSSGQFSRSYDTTGWTVGAYTGWVTVAGIKSNVVSFTVLAPVAADTKTPIGFLDGIDASGNAFGWALDPDSSSVSISVHFYIDGAAGSSGAVYAGSALANLLRPDLNTAYPGNHGYTFSIPQQWRDGKTHKLYVHGIDVSGNGTKNVLLSQVPKGFILGTAVSIPVVSVSPNSFYPGAQMTTSITKGAPNAQVLLFCRDPNGAVCDDANSGTTNSSGQFSRSYDTTGWTVGAYTGWVTVAGIKSNVVSFTVLAPVAADTKTPIGFLDGIDASGNAFGWALDPDNSSQSIAIHFYIDGIAGSSGAVYAGSAFANLPRPDINATHPGNHGYTFSIPQQWRDGKTHKLYVHGIDVSGDGTKNVLLSQVPKGFTLGTLISNNPALSVSPTSFVAGAMVTISVANAAPNAAVKVFCRDPNSVVCDDSVSYTTNMSGQFAHTYDTTGWTVGVYRGWVTVNGVQSNEAGFTVTAPSVVSSITVLSPNGGEVWQVGKTYPITWSTAGYGTDAIVQISLIDVRYPFDESGGTIIIDRTLNTGSYSWTIPSTTILTSEVTGPIYKIRIYIRTVEEGGWGGANTKDDISGTPFNIIVTEPPILSVAFEISPAIVTLGIGKTQTLTARFTPPGGTAQDVTNQAQWSSSNSSVVELGAPPGGTVNNTALGKSVGSAVITAAYQWQTAQAQITIGGQIGQQAEVLPVGATAVYKGNGKIWVASRINADTILFERWNDPLSSTNTVWRSKSQDGAIVSESSSEIYYKPITFYDQGMPADVFGKSDGPYDIWLAPAGLYIARSDQTKTLTATRIGYGTLPAFYSRQWCGLGTICNKALAEDQWDGWPIFGFILQKENGTDIASIFTGPLWSGFEIIQASLVDNGTSKELRGQAYKPCSAWTTTLGLCQNGVLYMAGANEVLRVKLDENNLQWWYDSNFDGSVGCEEFGKTGAQLPDAVVPHAVAIKLTDRNSPTRAESSWTASKEGACITTGNLVSYSVFSLPSSSFVAGVSFVGSVTKAVPNTQIRTFSKGPDGVTTEYTPGITSSTGTFSQTYNTVGWASGAYQIWVDVNGVQSNIVSFTVTAPSASGRFAPTPTTAPMATLTLEHEQEQVLPNQPIAFSGTLDASQVAFPQGSTLFIAIPEKTIFERIEIDGRTLGSGEVTVSGSNAKISFLPSLYEGSHRFRIVLRNEISSIPQLDRTITVWVSVVGTDNKLLLKGRTASVLVAHLPTEVIGRGTSIAIGTAYYDDNSNRVFRYLQSAQDVDVTRGPFFTPTSVPPLPDNIAFTLFPGDATMQRIALTLKSFSEPLSREFITAQYQYLFGRDPSSEEISRYLPLFTQWRNSLGALMEVYNRRADVREFARVPERVIKDWGGIRTANLSNYDKLIEWATTQGWKEEPSLQSFKMQTGYDDAWKLFAELQEKWAPFAIGSATGWSETTTPSTIALERDSFNLIFELCGGQIVNNTGGPPESGGGFDIVKADFAACWNNPIKRHQMILWAKDIGWAYNQVVQSWSTTTPGGSGDTVQTGRNIVKLNPSGPILAFVFGPGKYPEYVVEQQWRYPPAQMYYDLISSPEYASSIQQRFRTNIDSVLRLFFSRPANENDIVWVKNKFLGGIASFELSDSKSFGFDRNLSWINDQWEPNGQLIASNFNYIDEVEFVKNPRYINDDVYGIRYIPGEIDAISSRLVEMIERRGRQELYQGDNFKRIVTGLYRLYLRRNPTDAEIELRRASGKDFGDIEFKLNQSSEYGEGSASAAAIRNMYRNYLGRDPSDADIASWAGKSISTVASALGKSSELRSYAQKHRENAYIFPVKEIKIKKCGFFCSVLSKIISAIPVVGSIYAITVRFATGFDVWRGPEKIYNLTNIVLNSIGRGFNESGFNGKTFVSWVSIARAMAGQAGGVFSMTNLFENADPTILDGFRTMAKKDGEEDARIAGSSGGFSYAHAGFASLLSAVTQKDDLASAKDASAVQPLLAQIDVSGHYGGGFVGGQQLATQAQAAKSAITKKLIRGSRGAEVLLLQKILGGSDLTFSSQYHTGYYGPKTEAAVKRFQKRNGLPQVGFVGPKTKALLNSGQ